ncbi:unnamed protein product [Cuscuta europaea]|uniref:Uncharacterized protein n=1 Tax=Cuscuta europaea TaxID=41803 RepID=A0A9P0ZW89_CUSEU|nr:unnamed protein product [Cuscuta europaea]
MAVDVCSDDASSSPRISFSHDLRQSDTVPSEFHLRCLPDPLLFEPTIDFDFCTSFIPEISPADELFADGKILPVQIKKPAAPFADSKSRQPKIANTDDNKKMLKEFLSANPEPELEPGTLASPAKHFWQFGRSSSLNCDTRRGNSLVRSLQFLSRSNSTGSAPNGKLSAPPPQAEAARKQRSRPEPFLSRSVSSVLFNTHRHNHLMPSKKTMNSPLKKSCSFRSSGYGVRVIPVLNISPTYNTKHTFFGLGSLFCNGKSKRKKR